MRFTVNGSILLTELPLLERPAAVRAAGFEAVELWWPFATATPEADDVEAAITHHRDRVAHVQIADAPGRDQPGTGELPIGVWLDDLEAGGYDGWVGLEYKPASPASQADPFGWLPRDRRA